MVVLTVGSVILVPFPFSDLSQTKMRPALVLADVGNNDWILCQITSNPYGDKKAITLFKDSFQSGFLQLTSYVRPGKLFTSNSSLIVRSIGVVKREVLKTIIAGVVEIISPDSNR